MSYVAEYKVLFKPPNGAKLRERALEGELRNCSFRSLCWRYFLHCLPDTKATNEDQLETTWIDKCSADRRDYEIIRERHAVDPRRKNSTDDGGQSSGAVTTDAVHLNSSSETVNNPLSQDANSPWNQYFADTQLRNVIRQDVIRTFPDMEFFRSAEIQTILQNVLFHFARENPSLSYKQGMHELLASLLFVIHRDIQTCIIAEQGDLANNEIVTLLDINYLEHDVYMTFNQLMQTIETWYQNDEILPPKDTAQDNAGKQSGPHHVRSVLGLKLKMISESIVKRHDCELYNHLEALQIVPQIFGIRWMRLLFGREFPFMDLLVVWDAIIGDGISFALTDYLFASMLITIRELLVNSDYTDCLNHLMRYPPIKDVQCIIKFALHLREPQRYIMPTLPFSAHRYLDQHKKPVQLGVEREDQHSNSSSKNNSNINTSRTNSVTSTSNRGHANTPTSKSSVLGSNQQRPTGGTHGRSSRSSSMSSTSISSSSSSKANSHAKANTSSTSIGPLLVKSFLSNKAIARQGAIPPPIFHDVIESISRNKSAQSTSNENARRAKLIDATKSKQTRATPPSSVSARLPLNADLLARSQPREMYSFAPTAANHSRHQLAGSPGASPSSSSVLRRSGLQQLPHGDSIDDSDLSTKVDYCWRLLSAQIDSLQRCLPKEKNLNSEDEIYIALAQLKKVRDVLKGSLKLEDELGAQLQ